MTKYLVILIGLTLLGGYVVGTTLMAQVQSYNHIQATRLGATQK